jgi:tungstate transport system ATP-binding protein
MLRRSAAGNVRYALGAAGVPRAEHDPRTANLLALVGLEGLQRRPARQLSGGEQQRLALARALARDPAVLFLDEPTASLDPYATKAIEDVVRAVTGRGVKVVISTHDLGQAKRISGEIVLLHRGRLIETGPAAEFFANPRTREAKQFIGGELLI